MKNILSSSPPTSICGKDIGSNPVSGVDNNVLYGKGIENKRQGNIQGSIYYFQKSATTGHVESQMELAKLYQKSDLSQTFYWFNMASKAGNAEAIYMIGYMYEHGKSVEKNMINALYHYQLSASRGYVDAAIVLGEHFNNGTYVNRNIETSLQWYMKAAEKDDTEGQFYSGVLLYEKGQKDEALEWFKKAGEQGHGPACFNVGCYMIEKGESDDAINWIIKANDIDNGLYINQLNILLDNRKNNSVHCDN